MPHVLMAHMPQRVEKRSEDTQILGRLFPGCFTRVQYHAPPCSTMLHHAPPCLLISTAHYPPEPTPRA